VPWYARSGEELAALLVAEREQIGPQLLEHRSQPGDAGECLRVLDARRAVGGQVAADEPRHRERLGRDAVKPGLGGEVGRRASAAPQPARRHLDEGDELADAHRERIGIAAGPALAQPRAELAERARLVEERPRGPFQLAVIDAGRPSVGRVPRRSLDCRPHQLAQRQAVARRDQVDGGAHERYAHDLAVEEQLLERLRPEAGDARPQADVGRPRRLRLDPDQMLDGGERRNPAPAQQELAGEQRPVQPHRREHASLGHRIAEG
jgi:hypothetical protein